MNDNANFTPPKINIPPYLISGKTPIVIFIGILISSLVIYLQNQFQIINLPSEKIFQLTFLPAHFDIFYFIKYPIFLILFTILISLYVFNKNFKIYLK